MTDDLTDFIREVVGNIGRQFYEHNGRAFFRDQRALAKAVSRYGYECNARGWEFSAREVEQDILALLQEIKRSGAEFRNLPVYLEGAIARRIGQRSEEMASRADANASLFSKRKKGDRRKTVAAGTAAESIVGRLAGNIREGARPLSFIERLSDAHVYTKQAMRGGGRKKPKRTKPQSPEEHKGEQKELF